MYTWDTAGCVSSNGCSLGTLLDVSSNGYTLGTLLDVFHLMHCSAVHWILPIKACVLFQRVHFNLIWFCLYPCDMIYIVLTFSKQCIISQAILQCSALPAQLSKMFCLHVKALLSKFILTKSTIMSNG